MDEKKCLKEPISVEEQIANLKANNLIIEDEEYAKNVLNKKQNNQKRSCLHFAGGFF